MEIVERKKQKTSVALFNYRSSFLLLTLGIMSILLEKAFLFNPLILVVLYLSIEKSLVQYLFSFTTMSLMAFLIDPSYGLEIVLISFVLFLLHQFFLKIHQKSVQKRVDLVVLCGLLTLLMCIKSWSFTHLALCLIATGLSYLWTVELNQLQKAIEDETQTVKDVTLWLAGLFGFTLSMVHPILGFVFIRLLLLCIPKDKKMLLISLATSSALMILFIYQYPLTYALMVIGPSFVAALFEKKQKIIAFLIAHLLVFLALDPLFYTNGIFYQGIATSIVYLMFSFKITPWMDEFVYRERTLQNQENKNQYIQTQQSISYLYDFISAMDFELGKQEKTPVQKARLRVYKSVCAKCSHLLYCPLTKDLETMVQGKLTPSLRKSINRDCITPYKLTLSIQQSSAIFLNEENYYQECLRRKEAIIELIESLKEPLKEIKSLPNQKDYQREKLLAHLEISGIPLEDFYYQKEKWIFMVKEELSPEQENDILELLKQIKKERYALVKKERILFSSHHRYVFEKEPMHQISYLTYQKGCNPNANGDQLKILQKDTQFIALLCDGMGHDERAERTAKSLLNSFLALYQHSTNVQKNLDQLNRLFRISLDGDNYSTFDFFHIDLQSLELTNYKGGSCPTFMIRDGKLLVLPNGGLPIGLLDEVEVESKRVQLEKNDILLITSDGISQFIQDQDPIIFQKIENKNEFFRSLFQLSISSMKHFDDATMIVCEIL